MLTNVSEPALVQPMVESTTTTTTAPPVPTTTPPAPTTTVPRAPTTTTTTIPSLEQVSEEGVGTVLGNDPNAARDPYASPVGYMPPSRPLQDGTMYSGDNRVNATGQFEYKINPLTGKAEAQKGYLPSTDFQDALFGMEQTKRKEFFTDLYKHGMYLGEKPSPGFDDPFKEGQVVIRLMSISNKLGVTWDVGKEWVMENTPLVSSGTQFKVSSALDIGEIANRQSQDILGVGATAKQKKRITGVVQAGERSASSRGEQPSSPTSAVRQNIREASPDQAKAFSFAKYAQLLQRMMAQQ